MIVLISLLLLVALACITIGLLGFFLNWPHPDLRR